MGVYQACLWVQQAVLLDESAAGPIAIAGQQCAYLVMVPVALAARAQYPPRTWCRVLAGVCRGVASVALFQGLRFDPLATVTAARSFPFTVACWQRRLPGRGYEVGKQSGISLLYRNHAVVAG